MDDPKINRAPNNSGMPASSILLASTFHASIIFALLWVPLTKTPALVPDDAVELTIERQPASSATVIQPPVPVPEPSAPQVEPAPAPTLEGAVPEPEPAPELTLRDFQKTEPVIRKTEQKKPAPKADPKTEQPAPKAEPKTDPNKAFVPAPEGIPQNASPPTPLPNQADVVPPNKKPDERGARMWGTRYLERMGIRPSHLATLTATSGGSCYQDPEPYKLEITNNKLTVTNNYGIMFSITVPADGEIYQNYKRPRMSEDIIEKVKGTWMEYTMKGNVKSGKLEIWHYNCVYKLNLY
jgi:hypothetical protein